MPLEEGDVSYQGDFMVVFNILRILILQLELVMDIDGPLWRCMTDEVMGYRYGCSGVFVGLFDKHLGVILLDSPERIGLMYYLYYYASDHFHHGFRSHY